MGRLGSWKIHIVETSVYEEKETEMKKGRRRRE
jgi:hypothetical protein